MNNTNAPRPATEKARTDGAATEAGLRSAFEHLSAFACLYLGRDQALAACNAALRTALGAEAGLDRPAAEALVPFGGALLDQLDAALASRVPRTVSLPSRLIDGAGQVTWTLAPANPDGLVCIGHAGPAPADGGERTSREDRLLAGIVASCPDAICAKDLGGRVTFANSAMARAFPDLSVADLIGRRAADLFDDPSLAAAIDASDRKVMASGAVERTEEKVGDRIFQTVKAPLHDAARRVEGLVCFSRDVTAERQAERDLVRSRDLLRLALEAGRLGVWDIDIAAGVSQVDAATREIYGRPDWPPEVPLAEADALVLPDDLPHLQEQRRQADETGRFGAEYRIRRPDGEIRWLAAFGQVRSDADGRPVWAVGVLADVTERRDAEESLRRSEERLARERAFLDTVIESVPVGLSVARDPMGQPPILNAEGRRMMGIKEYGGGMSRYRQFGAIHPDGTPYEIEEYPTVRALNGIESHNLEMIHLADGERRRWLLNSRPLRDEAGRIVAAVTAFVDVEEQRRAEEHRELLLQELNHRVKNILAVVRALASQTFRGAVDAEAARRAFEGRLTALAEAHNLLVRGDWRRSRLDAVLRSSLETGCPDGKRVAIAGPPVWIEARTAITLAIAAHELCTNALKYGALSREAGRVDVAWEVRSTEDGRRLRLTWRERGGPPVAPPERGGFGMQMLERALAAEMEGEVRMEFEPAGLVCRIDAPIADDQNGGA